MLTMAETYKNIYGRWSVKDPQMKIGMQPDFKEQKSRLEEGIRDRGHLCRFLPKFHCELNFTELYWCKTKEKTRKRKRMTWAGLKESMWQAFGHPGSLEDDDGEYQQDSSDVPCLSSLFLQRASRKAREFFRVYYEHSNERNIDLHGLKAAIKKQRRLVVQQVQNLARETRRDRHLAPVMGV